MSIYWIIVIIVLGLGLLIPEKNMRSRRLLVFFLFAVHLFVCGFKYSYLTGDLYLYNSDYKFLLNCDLFSVESFNSGRNPLWTFLNKVICDLSNGNFKVFIFIHALIVEGCMAYFVMKYSPKPWLSCLVWDCMSFYLYGFSAIKQSLAMAVLLIAVDGIFEHNKKKFFTSVCIASLIHFPAALFLPSYWLTKKRPSSGFAIGCFLSLVVAFLFRNPIANFLSSYYYNNNKSFADVDKITGGRFFVVLMIVGSGFLIKGLREERFKIVFILVTVSAIPQLLSVFDNIFTRLADYYLQFTILYFPLLLTPDNTTEQDYDGSRMGPLIALNEKSRPIVTITLVAALVFWFYIAEMRFATPDLPETYYNFSFFWEH